MKKVLVSLIIAMSMTLLIAQASDVMKVNHEKMLRYNGDEALLAGQHYDITRMQFSETQEKTPVQEIYASVYTLDNTVAYYAENEKFTTYIIIKIIEKVCGLEFVILNKHITKENTKTLKYSIVLTEENTTGIKVNIDDKISDIYTDKDKIIASILKQTAKLYALRECFLQKNFEQSILKIVRPVEVIYKDIFTTNIHVDNGRIKSIAKRHYYRFGLGHFSRQYTSLGNVLATEVVITYIKFINYVTVSCDLYDEHNFRVYISQICYFDPSFQVNGYVYLIFKKH